MELCASMARRGRVPWQVRAIYLVGMSIATALALAAAPPDIPMVPGVTFVMAVSNAASPPQTSTLDHLAQGDYETVVTITAVNDEGISQNAFIDGVDESGVHQQSTIPRKVLRADLAKSHLQVFGFYSTDPLIVTGTTALGPSLAITKELLEKGRSAYSFRNFSTLPTISGTLIRSEVANVKFPVLVNGQRVELNAIHATGQMASGSATRPFEQFILAEAQYPISLRIAYGPRGGAFPFKADFAREIVRIDFPVKQGSGLAEALAKNCRVEIPGIYFDFNEATLKAQSKRALQDIAAVLNEQPKRHVSIEGHTDNIGGAQYNDDLSARRAATVKAALVEDFKIDPATISTKGFGLRRPRESNETLAGRARNRRVELVRECSDGK
jgi:outer membrane protein OmpA-like peptidoglycan-associated protein